MGLFATTPPVGWSAGAEVTEDASVTGSNPTLVSNVETLANVPLILARGVDWFRSVGTAESPGTVIATVVGDVQRAGRGGARARDAALGGHRLDRRRRAVRAAVQGRVVGRREPGADRGRDRHAGRVRDHAGRRVGHGRVRLHRLRRHRGHGRGRAHGEPVPLRRVVRAVPGVQVRHGRGDGVPREHCVGDG